MTPPLSTHFVFVDFENVPEVDLGLVEGKPVRVALLIGKNQTRLGLPLVQQIHRLAAQVELVEVGASGHNALDLTLACYLGRAIQLTPAASFHIVSKDKGFEPLIGHLKAKAIHVSRHESFAGLPFLAPKKSTMSKAPFVMSKPSTEPKAAKAPKAPSSPKQGSDQLAKFIQHLRNSPPSNRTKLEHMLEAFFPVPIPAGGIEGVVVELTKRKIIVIDESGKVRCL